MACANPASGVREGALRPGAPAPIGIPKAQLEPPPSFAVCPALCEASGGLRFALAWVWNTLPAIGRSACCPFPVDHRQSWIVSLSTSLAVLIVWLCARPRTVLTLTRIAQGTLRMIDNTIDRLGAKATKGPGMLRN
jgi:hypothetical protein